jgi:inward rectifier potassium channel
LLRSHIPVFPLTWTLMHKLDEKSPLFGFDAESMVVAEARLFVSLEARDPTLASMVHELRDYEPADLRFGMRYADAISEDKDGSPLADLTRISALEPDAGDERGEPGWTPDEQAEKS